MTIYETVTLAVLAFNLLLVVLQASVNREVNGYLLGSLLVLAVLFAVLSAEPHAAGGRALLARPLVMSPAEVPASIRVVFGIAVVVLAAGVVAALLHHRRQPDICADQRPQLVPIPRSYAAPVECILLHGHRTQWHRGQDGSEWTDRGHYRPRIILG